MVKGRNSEFSSKARNFEQPDLQSGQPNPGKVFLESRHSVPFSENSIRRRFRFIGKSNIVAETGNVQSGWSILVAEWP